MFLIGVDWFWAVYIRTHIYKRSENSNKCGFQISRKYEVEGVFHKEERRDTAGNYRCCHTLSFPLYTAFSGIHVGVVFLSNYLLNVGIYQCLCIHASGGNLKMELL